MAPSSVIHPVLLDLASHLTPNFDPVRTRMGKHEALASADPAVMRQKWWAEALGKCAMSRLLDSTSPRDQARLLEQSCGIGSAWMAVMPNQSLRTSIPSEDFILGLKWWLGIPVINNDASAYRCPGCTKEVDVFGDHLLCCARNNFALRHNAVQEAIANILTLSGQPFAKEVQLPDAPDGELRPADILLSAWQEGLPTAVDLTICHGWQVAERHTQSRERWRSFLRRKEAAKHAKYDAPCRAQGWAFVPMAMGTWGGMGPEGMKLMRRIIKRSATWLEGDLRAWRQQELLQSVGLTLMRHVWRLLGGKNYVLS
jgi:hypothetical protein